MGKIKRATTRTAAFPRAPMPARAKSTSDQSGRATAQRRGAPDSGSGREKLAMPAGDDSVLDEWLEPDEDADLDQWLHDHGADSLDD